LVDPPEDHMPKPHLQSINPIFIYGRGMVTIVRVISQP